MCTMEFSPLVIAFSVAVLTLLPYCSSGEANVQTSVTRYVHQSQFSPPLFPRKLKLQEEAFAKRFAGENVEPHRKMEEATSPGKKQENVMMQKKHRAAAGKGTWREWVDEEGPNRSEYFTMDYGWVRRRRPIHNKQIPHVP